MWSSPSDEFTFYLQGKSTEKTGRIWYIRDLYGGGGLGTLRDNTFRVGIIHSPYMLLHCRRRVRTFRLCLILSFDFVLQIFNGNTDQSTVVTALFDTPVQAAVVRIVPTEWHNHISMRFEVLGCEGNVLSYY
jgi:hypothetical protein